MNDRRKHTNLFLELLCYSVLGFWWTNYNKILLQRFYVVHNEQKKTTRLINNLKFHKYCWLVTKLSMYCIMPLSIRDFKKRTHREEAVLRKKRESAGGQTRQAGAKKHCFEWVNMVWNVTYLRCTAFIWFRIRDYSESSTSLILSHIPTVFGRSRFALSRDFLLLILRKLLLFSSAHASPSFTPISFNKITLVHSHTNSYMLYTHTHTHTHTHTYRYADEYDTSRDVQLRARFCTALANVLPTNRHGSITCHFSAALSVPVLVPVDQTLDKIRSPSPMT